MVSLCQKKNQIINNKYVILNCFQTLKFLLTQSEIGRDPAKTRPNPTSKMVTFNAPLVIALL